MDFHIINDKKLSSSLSEVVYYILCQGKSISLVACFAQNLKILINQKLENISPSSIVAKDILTRINNQLFKRFHMLDPAIKNEKWLNIDESQNFHLSKKQLLKKFSGNV